MQKENNTGLNECGVKIVTHGQPTTSVSEAALCTAVVKVGSVRQGLEAFLQ